MIVGALTKIVSLSKTICSVKLHNHFEVQIIVRNDYVKETDRMSMGRIVHFTDIKCNSLQ